MKRRITSHDVARLAGVSRATVSLALNRSSAVAISKETRERVFEAAAALDYRPNSAARMLVRGHAETVALIISDARLLEVDAFVPQILRGVGRAVRDGGYRLLVDALPAGEAAPGDRARGDAYLDFAEAGRVDGMIVLDPPSDNRGLQALIEQGFPLVLLGSARHPGEHAVTFRTQTGVARGVAHLAALGHRRIGHITFSPAGFVTTDARLRAFRLALRKHGLAMDDALVAHGDYSAASGHAAMRRLLPAGPTAVLAGNDTIALGAVMAIREAGLDVPGDIAVVGFDDLPFAAFVQPPLTTVRVPAVRQGELAAAMLLSLLRREPVNPRRVEVETELVVRASCGARGRCAGSDGR